MTEIVAAHLERVARELNWNGEEMSYQLVAVKRDWVPDWLWVLSMSWHLALKQPFRWMLTSTMVRGQIGNVVVCASELEVDTCPCGFPWSAHTPQRGCKEVYEREVARRQRKNS